MLKSSVIKLSWQLLPLLMVPTTKSQLSHFCLGIMTQKWALKASRIPRMPLGMKFSTGPQPLWTKLVMTLLQWVPVKIMDCTHFSCLVWNETLFLLKLTFLVLLIFEVCILVGNLQCKCFYYFVACEYPNKNSCLLKDIIFPVCPVSYAPWLCLNVFLSVKTVAFWRWLVVQMLVFHVWSFLVLIFQHILNTVKFEIIYWSLFM